MKTCKVFEVKIYGQTAKRIPNDCFGRFEYENIPIAEELFKNIKDICPYIVWALKLENSNYRNLIACQIEHSSTPFSLLIANENLPECPGPNSIVRFKIEIRKKDIHSGFNPDSPDYKFFQPFEEF